MYRRPIASTALFLATLLLPADLPAATPIEGRGGKCLECHKVSLTAPAGGSGHAVFTRGDCWACHRSHGEEPERIFLHEGSRLCRCHRPDTPKFAQVHPKPTPTEVPCLSCHKPHTSTKPHLLTDYLHQPLVTDSCAGCHTKEGDLVGEKTAEVCYRCHQEAAFRGVSRHEPVADEECTACHDPHGSRYPALLEGPYPEGVYVPWGETTYDLCFECHDKEAITAQGPAAPTGFKDGERNLHRLHSVEREVSPLGKVVRESMSCTACHQPHASLFPRLVRQDVRTGKGVTYLKLAYTVREGTATCETGCHRTLSYASDGSQASATVSPVAGARQPPAKVSYSSPCLVECHQDDWARFNRAAVVHDPVRKKKCADCHGEHGSEQRMRSAGDRNAICGTCHQPGSEQIVAGHAGMDVSGSRCLRCHSPHSSVNRGLLKEFAHEPFAEQSCWDCHEEGSGRAISRNANEVCSACHEEILETKRPHGAISRGQCTACHDPHDGERASQLVAGIPDLCFRCHDRKSFTRASRHAPADQGKCLECHAAHGRSDGSMLVREGNGLCLGCHDPRQQTFQKRHFKLAVTKASCRSCHASHSAEKEGLIRADAHRPLLEGKCLTCHREGGGLRETSVASLCHRCHGEAEFNGPSRHEPVADGECTTCHDPHGSIERPLLVASYPLVRYLPFSAGSFGLCFSCHDPETFTDENPGAGTEFRNETTNLHYLHVVKTPASEAARSPREGLTCRNCHLPHASLSPHLVRQEMDCGGGVQCLKLGYVIREGKGTCRGGCHKAATYATTEQPEVPTP